MKDKRKVYVIDIKNLFILPDSIEEGDADILRLRFFSEPIDSFIKKYVTLVRSRIYDPNLIYVIGENFPKDLFSYAIDAITQGFPKGHSENRENRVYARSYTTPHQRANILIELGKTYEGSEVIELTKEDMDKEFDKAKEAGLRVRGFKEDEIKAIVSGDKEKQAKIMQRLLGATEAPVPDGGSNGGAPPSTIIH